jgi:structural maintenance of chromosome 4
VFGKRAKQLRLAKVSELIHASAKHRPDAARVTVHFHEIIDQGLEDYRVVPGSAFSVSRTALRNNSSSYYVNDRKAAWVEVSALLKGKGVDLDNNRFLILQGEVESIALMKPKATGPHDSGLLEYLEDIIGTDQYIPALEEGTTRLDGLNDARQAADRFEDDFWSGGDLAALYKSLEGGTHTGMADIFVNYMVN